ncbi:GNAT family N-acetyltransferase [Streptomyces sp. NPDC020875]|uniref:GNAT family N-acetyltransferase n=1 Tax=Streptomyces sp. NPDC020875 TaxID=3154898 RepID=UPI0033FBD70E
MTEETGEAARWRVDEAPGPAECAEVLAAAFVQEGTGRWICRGSDSVRRRWFAGLLATQATVAGGRRMMLTGPDGRAVGAAVLTPPGGSPSPGARLGWTVRTLALCGGRTFSRTLRYLDRTERLAPPGAWTLEFIGVRPEDAGQGAGRWLLGELLDRTPAPEGVFLTTSDGANVGFYESFGFIVLERLRIGPLETTAMWRPPGATAPR